MWMKNFKLGTRIYIAMLMLLIVSFVVIGTTTVYHFSSQNDTYHEKRLRRKEKAIMASIDYFVDQKSGVAAADSLILLVSDKIVELADINSLDINIYSLTGDFLITSREEYFDKRLLQFKLGEDILGELASDSSRAVMEQRVDTVDIISAYRYIMDSDNRRLAILNIPYVQSDQAAKADLRSFLLALSQVYLVLFVGASILAYFLTNYFTGSIKAIATKLTEIDLSHENEPIEWDRTDEIGTLVDSYNEMLLELRRSAEKIANSERESAWREMAQQVAHEIKNPLTPMRLSAQHMQRALSPDDPDWQEKLDRFTNTMIDQIDTLTAIANEFSDFAQMPKPNNEELVVFGAMEKVCMLFEQEQSVKVTYEISISKEAVVFMDKDHFKRIFNNVIKNAIQAIPSDRQGAVQITASENNGYLETAITDNGQGISEELGTKIFVPKFTTKSTGMGLGLAMVKNMVITAGGEISFESELDVGTTFLVKLPLKKKG